MFDVSILMQFNVGSDVNVEEIAAADDDEELVKRISAHMEGKTKKAWKFYVEFAD